MQSDEKRQKTSPHHGGASPVSSFRGWTTHEGVGAALRSQHNPGALYSRSFLMTTGLTQNIVRRTGLGKKRVFFWLIAIKHKNHAYTKLLFETTELRRPLKSLVGVRLSGMLAGQLQPACRGKHHAKWVVALAGVFVTARVSRLFCSSRVRVAAREGGAGGWRKRAARADGASERRERAT